MTMEQILGWFGGISIVAGAIIAIQKLVVPPISAWWKAKQAKKDFRERISELEDKITAMTDRIKRGEEYDNDYVERKKVLTAVVEDTQTLKDGLASLQNANAALMYDKLHFLITKAMERGYTTFDEFDIINHLYIAYQGVRGNGVMAKWMSEYEKLEKKAD